MRTLELTPELQDLIDLTVKSAVNSVVEQLKKLSLKGTSEQNEDFLSAKQAAQYLKIEVSSLYTRVEKGDLSHYRSGKRKLLFSKKELEAYVTSQRVKSNLEIADEVEIHILNNARKR